MASVATVYSKALYNVAKEGGAQDRVAQELKDFLELCRVSSELRKVLYSSLFDSATRARVAEELAAKLKSSETTTKFLALIARKNRVRDLGGILAEFSKLRDRERGVVRGSMQSAVELSGTELEELTTSLSRRVGKSVELVTELNSELLGGFIVSVDGKTFDSSLRTQLRNLKEICTA